MLATIKKHTLLLKIPTLFLHVSMSLFFVFIEKMESLILFPVKTIRVSDINTGADEANIT